MANLGFIEGWNARVKLQTQSTDPPNTLATKKYVDDLAATSSMTADEKTKLGRVPSLSAANVFSTGFTVTGDLSVTGDILYDLSDVRLKTQFESIEDPISKILSLDTGFYYYNDIAKKYGFNNPTRQIGLKAQQVQAMVS